MLDQIDKASTLLDREQHRQSLKREESSRGQEVNIQDLVKALDHYLIAEKEAKMEDSSSQVKESMKINQVKSCLKN
jgi:hypothetical protein